MRIIETKVYSFDELTEEAKQNVIKEYRENPNNGDFEYLQESIIEDAKTIGALMGVDIARVYYNGFYSQGDGACFDGDYAYKKGGVAAVQEYAPQDIELHRIAQGLQDIQRRNFYKITCDIRQNGHYMHSRCTSITSENVISGDCIETEENVKELLRDFMDWIYKQLELEYENTQSDEYITAHFIDNDYEFKENGELI